MDADFWHRRWQENRIGFHLEAVNPWLTRHYRDWVQDRNGAVFVPMCGKSLDLAWLAERGHLVIGNELSELAVSAFFAEQGIVAEREPVGRLEWWNSDTIHLACGDFFALEPVDTAAVELVYDRAALVALPAAIRPAYARQLARLTPAGARMLLVTLEYDPQQMDGPPFAVADQEVQALYGTDFDIQCLGSIDCLEARHRERGVDAMQEKAYILVRHDAA
ncbi:MAG: thiopurine S-methyltransferase [Granulosicoccaceae bacterium]|jgi:thiopurine S-methyltransferase